MATINGSTNSKLWTFKLVTTESNIKIENNQSDIKVDVYLGRSSSAGASYMYGASISCPIDVTGCARQTLTYSNSNRVDIAEGAWLHLGSKTFTVTHDSDGRKTVTVSASFTNNISPSSGDATGSVTLTTIARATTPTLSSTSVTMGNGVTITLTPADNTFKHKLRYSFGSLSSQVAGLSEGNDFTPAGTRTITFTPPTSLGSQIPRSYTGTCTLDCYTYTSSGTHIGTKSVTISLVVPNYTPTASVSISGNNLLGGALVNGKSTLTVNITASTSYGAQITEYSSSIGVKTYAGANFTSDPLKYGTTSQCVESTVTDSRGAKVIAKSTTFSVYDYSSPYITTLSAVRQSDGTTVVVTLKAGVSPVGGKNSKGFSVTLAGKTNTVTPPAASPYTVDTTTTFTGIDKDKTFDVVATVYDAYTTITKTVALPTEAVTLDFHHSGKGVALGKVSEEEGLLDVAWPVKSPSVDNLCGGYGVNIPANADLNTQTYLKVGTYVCTANDIAATLKNCPTGGAFKMSVSNVLYKNPSPTTGANWYMAREITNLYANRYIQYVHCSASTGWTYGTWYALLDNSRVKDFIIEQGTYSDGWEYVKWNNGRIELWADKSLSFPATTQQGTYIWRTFVQIDMSNKLKKIIGGNCPVQYNGVVPQLCRNSSTPTMAEIMIVGGRTFEAFTTTVPIYIVGKWK